MKFGRGQQYVIHLLTDPEKYLDKPHKWGSFTCHEAHRYLGELMLYGTLYALDFRVAKGVQAEPERASCFVVLAKESRVNVIRLVKILNGEPLWLHQGTEILPILNWASKLPGISTGKSSNKNKLLDRAAKVVNLYKYWEEHDALPSWFLEARKKAQAKQVGGNGRKPEIWTP